MIPVSNEGRNQTMAADQAKHGILTTNVLGTATRETYAGQTKTEYEDGELRG
jgi:hypothetical protein